MYFVSLENGTIRVGKSSDCIYRLYIGIYRDSRENVVRPKLKGYLTFEERSIYIFPNCMTTEKLPNTWVIHCIMKNHIPTIVLHLSINSCTQQTSHQLIAS